jgi:hypothetical protein
MNDITVPNGGGLSTDLAAQFMTGIARSRAETQFSGGKPLLRMLRDGGWAIGQTNDEVQPESRWVVNILTLQHGWVCWTNSDSKNTLAGEIMASMLKPRPECPPPIDGIPYKEQRSFDLKCIDGDDSGLEVTAKITSNGGLRAVDALLAEIHKQLGRDPGHPCPVLQLQTTSYDHKQWGRIYKPILKIVGWSDMHGNTGGGGGEDLPKPAKPGGADPARELPFPFDVKDAVASPVPPVATAQLHTGQRRRPVSR